MKIQTTESISISDGEFQNIVFGENPSIVYTERFAGKTNIDAVG